MWVEFVVGSHPRPYFIYLDSKCDKSELTKKKIICTLFLLTCCRK